MTDSREYLAPYQKYLDLRASHLRATGGHPVEWRWDMALVPPSFEPDPVDSLIAMIHTNLEAGKTGSDAPRGVQQALHILNNPTLCGDLEKRTMHMTSSAHPPSLYNHIHPDQFTPPSPESGWSDPACTGTFCAVVDYFQLQPNASNTPPTLPAHRSSFRLTSAVYQTFQQTGGFISEYKYYILAPVVASVITAGILLALGQSKGIATIYTLF